MIAESKKTKDPVGHGKQPKRGGKNAKKVQKPMQSLKPINNGIILHVAEKPSIASSIAKALSQGSSHMEKSGMCPVHRFTTTNLTFPGHPKGDKLRLQHRVTSVVGHVFSVDFGKEFQSWDAVDPAELFAAPIIKKPTKKGVVKHLQSEARGVHCLVLWMDCDREGEKVM